MNEQMTRYQMGSRGTEGVVSAVVIGGLTLATAAIHASLGGLLFMANAIGYAILASALLVPIPLVARGRWLIRLMLLGFTLATIGGWILMGARFPLAYIDKAIELAIVVLLAIEIGRVDRGVFGVLDRLTGLIRPRSQVAGD